MSLLDRYFIRTIVSYSVMVLLVLLTLSGLFLFREQLDDIGEGTYGTVDAFWFTMLNLPQQTFEFMPIAVLLGSLLGLGTLARASELVVVRASGVSIGRVALSVALGGLLLVLVTAVVGEVLAPPLQKFARQQKAFNKSGNVAMAGGSAWVKDGDRIINVEEQTGASLFGGVYVYRFATPEKLASVARARSAVPEGLRWRLDQYAETQFGEERIDARKAATQTLETNVDSSFLSVAISKPRELPSMDLWRLIGYMKANGLETETYQFAFWSRLARTCAILVVALLAVPFAFGPLRSSGAGARLLVGVMIGIGFFLLQRTLESGAVVFDLNPILLAWMPTALLAALTAALIAATR